MSPTASRFRPLYSRHVLRMHHAGARPLSFVQFVRLCAQIEVFGA